MGIFIVAEAGLGHEGRIELAKRMVDEARVAGADAVKFQVYRTEELIHPSRDAERFERFKRKELSYSDFRELKEYSGVVGIEWFATPHTVGAFEFLVGDLGVETVKVGSGDRGEILDLAVRDGRVKRVFVSLGMRGEDEIRDLVVKYTDYRDVLTFLHCVTMYPVPDDKVDLEAFNYGRYFGYSDHTVGSVACVAAAALGASVIEKHLKLPESTGQDVAGALFGDEFGQMVRDVRRVEVMLGDGTRHYSEEERGNEAWALKKEDGLR